MARPKQKKHQNTNSKLKKPAKEKQHPTDITQFCSQLDILGLKIVQVISDGNCLFRALADQLEGNQEEHEKYRHVIVQHIMKHRTEFEPFIEDEVPFDKYCKSMEEVGTWAGHMELQAASLVTGNNICIHQFMSPRWYIQNFHDHDASMIHLSYHDGEHYNSVRLVADSSSGKASPIVLQMDAGLSADTQLAKVTKNKSQDKNAIDPGIVKIVMSGSGCESYSKAEEVLKDTNGDIDGAIEYLILEQGASCNDELSTENNLASDTENGNYEQREAYRDVEKPKSDAKNGNINTTDVQHVNKKRDQEKKFPKGSRKNIKENRLTRGKSSTTHKINGKSKKSKGKQDGASISVPEHLNLGALRI